MGQKIPRTKKVLFKNVVIPWSHTSYVRSSCLIVFFWGGALMGLLRRIVKPPILIKRGAILLEVTEAGYIIRPNCGEKLWEKSRFSPHYNHSRSDYLKSGPNYL